MRFTRNVLRKLRVEGIRLAVRYGALERRRESLQGRLDSVLKEMAGLEVNGSAAPMRRKSGGRRNGFRVSAATRAKMKAAALHRHRGNGKDKPEEAKTRRKWRMSAEGRQRIADAARRRWAAARAAKETPKAEVKA